jgi:hypothetical protein
MKRERGNTDWMAAFVELHNNSLPLLEKLGAQQSDFDPWDVWDLPGYKPAPKKRQRRKPSLAKAIRTARKQGVDLVVAPDGTLTLRCNQPDNGAMIATTNEWDEVLSRGTH